MVSASITTNGQITIPKEIRDYLKLDSGSKIAFVIDENGIVKLIPLNLPIQSLSGILSSWTECCKFGRNGTTIADVPVIGVDTNVLVRYLTKDDEQQGKKVTELLESGEQCFIGNIVLCELVWVLRGKPYQFSREEISSTVEALLQCSVFELENRSLVYQALHRFKQGRADFSDYIIGAIAQQSGCRITTTLDQKLIGEKGFDVL